MWPFKAKRVVSPAVTGSTLPALYRKAECALSVANEKILAIRDNLQVGYNELSIASHERQSRRDQLDHLEQIINYLKWSTTALEQARRRSERI